MSIGKVIGGIAFAAITIAGIYIGWGVKLLVALCYEITGYKLKSIDFQYLDLEFSVRVNNPSHIEVGIEGYNIDIFINNIWVANVTAKNPQTIGAEKSSILTIPVKVDYKKVFGIVRSKAILSYFANNQFEKIVVSLKGKFVGSALKIPISTKLELQQNLLQITEAYMKPPTPCKK